MNNEKQFCKTCGLLLDNDNYCNSCREYAQMHEAGKKWNEGRAEAEQQGLEKFRRLSNDPILHPSKFKK